VRRAGPRREREEDRPGRAFPSFEHPGGTEKGCCVRDFMNPIYYEREVFAYRLIRPTSRPADGREKWRGERESLPPPILGGGVNKECFRRV